MKRIKIETIVGITAKLAIFVNLLQQQVTLQDKEEKPMIFPEVVDLIIDVLEPPTKKSRVERLIMSE